MMLRTNPVVILLSAAAVAVGAAGSAHAQARVVNGRVTSQAATPALAPTFRSLVSAQSDVAWIGYTFAAVSDERNSCCADSGWSTSYGRGVDGGRWNGCRLEPATTAAAPPERGSSAPAGPVKLESVNRLVVLFRIVDRSVERIRMFPEECELDAGGRALTWLEGVKPAESVALLESFAVPQTDRTRKGTLDEAVTTIALHADPSADAALERLVAPAQPDAVRRKVTFWLGNARGARGLAVLQRLLRDDSSLDVRKGAVFGVAQSREAGAVDALVQLARSHGDGAVRGEAIFWLGQKAGAKAAGAISDRIENDPDTDVKKRAVFALSQMPPEQGVPLLINVARTHANPAVRKQAMFWLGQSKDPRAIGFFEEVLTRR